MAVALGQTYVSAQGEHTGSPLRAARRASRQIPMSQDRDSRIGNRQGRPKKKRRSHERRPICHLLSAISYTRLDISPATFLPVSA